MAASNRPFENEAARKREAEELFTHSIEHITSDEISSAAMYGQEKIRKLESSVPNTLQSLWKKLKLLVSVLCDYLTGDYREIPFSSIAAVAAAILYFVSPIDAIPDFIPVLGYVDDAAVLALCLKMVHKDMEKYEQWKVTKSGKA
jgi:uncharacterized membrane protein YkvA (DUF1232 family)